VNRKLAEKYLDGTCPAVESEWLRGVCKVLFTGRQKINLEKRLKSLEELEETEKRLKSVEELEESIASERCERITC